MTSLMSMSLSTSPRSTLNGRHRPLAQIVDGAGKQILDKQVNEAHAAVKLQKLAKISAGSHKSWYETYISLTLARPPCPKIVPVPCS